ncbi:oxidoreductase [Pseudonocardia sulfidoxydans NBRC 16205]|uniref:Oxidoreductase n=1 Tax=Pseudonocardia sulfidoxydans NBRC 16205 TaxID=1223511 RepID=A0A511DG23_9PSEU|nr:zinc-binding dehydrogenase [Pseudonocardia sulfidoxydans]GEL23730.1 oxidoreductase [Pseudonocardia sulfidoxydans NBRC 16205]
MRAWVPTLQPAEPVEWHHVEEPVPGPGEVLVAVEAYSPNRGEAFLLEAPRPGWRPGKDVAGTVAATGPDVRWPEVGTRVVAHPESGGWAERVVVPVTRLAELPDDIDAVVAAALPLAGLTALRLLKVCGPLFGKTVLVTGASGGVGHYLVELAAAQGAILTAVSSSPDRGRRLRELGAAEIVHDVADTSGPFDVVVESVGGDVLPKAWARLAGRGLLVWLGQASREPVTLDFFDWSGAESGTLRKFSYADSDRGEDEDLATLVRLVQAGRLHPEIGDVRPWSDTCAALTDLVARKIRGNVVLTVDPGGL